MGDSFQLRISRRARYLRIDVSARQGVVVVVPEGTPRDVVNRFLLAKRNWIRRARERIARQTEQARAHGPALPERVELPALGEDYRVAIEPAARRSIRCDGEILRVRGATEPAAVRRAVVDWLKRRGRATLPPWLAAHAQRHGLSYARTMVRGQRTRWGSCSARGTISLNYKLLFLPRSLVDHVLLHELAHTRHLDHSPRFWALLAELDPQWRRHHAALSRAARCLPAWITYLETDDSTGR